MAKADRIIAQLLKLARKERELLIAGRLEDIARLEVQKDALLTRLGALPDFGNSRGLVRLKRAAEDNQHLYGAALSGIRRARDQIAVILKEGGADFQTYSPNGGRRAIGRSEPKIRRRA